MSKLKIITLFYIICITCITVTSQTTITLYPTKDAYLLMCLKPGNEYMANTNYGTFDRFFSGEWTSSGYRVNERSLVDFDFSLIPRGAEILSAKISLYAYQPQTDDGTRHVSYIIKQNSGYTNNESYLLRVTSPWEEMTVTYNTQPSTTEANKVLLAQSTSTSQNYIDINVTALVQDIVNNPETSYGIMLKLANEQKYCRMAFCSRNHNDPSRWPKLVVTYKVYEFTNYEKIMSNNYIFSSTKLYNNITGGTEYIENIQYYDGLGRPVQTVECRASPTNKDIIQPVEYDQFGREKKKYLPYTINSTTPGTYRNNWKTEQENFYYGNLSKPYSLTVYDNSPLNRVIKQGFQGGSWQPDTTTTTRSSNEHVISYTYSANGANEVYYWTITGEYPNVTFTRHTYNAGTLYKTTTYDENNNSTTEYKDLQGKTVLKVDALGGKTYYIYDEFELLRCVIPPLASQTLAATTKTSFTVNEADFQELCYYYEYDYRHRMIKKKLPGTIGIYEMKYDNLDRLIETKDPNGNKIYTTYDIFSRPIETGDLIKKEWLTKTIYDYYGSYKTNNIFSFKQVYSQSSGFEVDTCAKSKITVSIVKVLNPSPDIKATLTTVIYYDKYGRVIQTISETHLGGIDIISTLYKYKNSDIVYKTKHQHWKSSYVAGSPDHTIEKIYTYDHAGRLLKEVNIIDNNAPETVSEMAYDETSKVKNKKVGTIKTLYYNYNIRNWLRSIYDEGGGVPSCGIFGFNLSYSYNGNITSLGWHYGEDIYKRYSFTYDKLNRLIKSYYNYEETTNDIIYGSENKYSEEYTYDANGNIKTVKRRGLLQDGTGLVGYIDDLTYRYYNNNKSNKLYAVGDNAPDVWGRGDFNECTSDGYNYKEYFYDNNGNLINDWNNAYKFFSISYNLLNLPEEIYSEYAYMKITYNTNGVKLCQYASNNTSLKKYDYVGPFVYNNGLLSYIITSEGRAVFNNNKLNYFEYHIKDHLGNVRVVFQKLKSGNSYYANVVQKNDYYPFGMLMGSTYQTNTTSKNKYLYNGKELISEYDIELNWYDYGARMYDAQLGRWNSVDPMADKYFMISPYTYCNNNPMIFIDPTGMYIVEGSQIEWKKLRNDIANRRDNLQKKVDRLITKAEAKGWNAEKLASKIGDKTERIATLSSTLNTMSTLESSNQGYSLSHTKTGEYGGVSLNTETNIIDIKFESGNTANFVHEVTHAGQFETGDIAFDSKTGMTLAQDIYDEVAAYKAQYAYDPSSVSRLTSTSVANSYGSITASWVQGLGGGSLYVPIGSPNYIQGVSANTGVGPLNINSTRADFINAYPAYPGFKTLPASYILKTSYPNIYYKK